MKQLIKIVLVLVIITDLLSGCRVQGPAAPFHAFSLPSHKTRHHWGAPRHSTVRKRYWGAKRYGPRPHSERGRFRD